MRAALQKLESRVVVLEKSPAAAAVPCAKVNKTKRWFSVHAAADFRVARSSALHQVTTFTGLMNVICKIILTARLHQSRQLQPNR